MNTSTRPPAGPVSPPTVSAAESGPRDRAAHEPGGRPPLRARERLLVALEALTSLSGLGGGLYLMARPLGAMPLHYLDGTWFRTWRWPGAALFVLVGVAPAVVAAATVLRVPAAPFGHVVVGAGLVAWIVLEAAWIVVSPPLQIAFGAVGLVILVVGLVDLRGR